jgi:hypothetical protein
VQPFLANALKSSGMVAFVGDNLEPRVIELEPPAQVRTADQPPILPSDPVGNRILAGDDDTEQRTVTYPTGAVSSQDKAPQDKSTKAPAAKKATGSDKS